MGGKNVFLIHIFNKRLFRMYKEFQTISKERVNNPIKKDKSKKRKKKRNGAKIL